MLSSNDFSFKFWTWSFVITFCFEFLNQLFFHVGTWLRLEDLTRKYAVKYGTIHVISGAIFDEDNNGKVDEVGEEKKLVTIAIQNR